MYGHYHHYRRRTSTSRMVYKCRTSWEFEIRVEIGQVCDVTYDAACDWPRHGCVCSQRARSVLHQLFRAGRCVFYVYDVTAPASPRCGHPNITLSLDFTNLAHYIANYETFFRLFLTLKPLKYEFSYIETTEKIKW